MDYVKRMNRVEKSLACGLGGLLLARVVCADVSEATADRYQVIVERNGFGLKPPPLVTPPATNAPPVKSDVKMTGITSNFAGRKVWLMIPPGPGRKDPQYLSIPEHETQGDIQVLEINEKESTVKILNAGVAVTLNFKENGLPTPAALPLPGNPATPYGAPGAVPQPGIVPAPGTPPPAIKTASAAPANMSPEMAARYGLQPAGSAETAAVHTIPTRNVRTAPVETQATEAPVDPAVQRVLMEAQAAEAKNRGVTFPPLPPLPGNAGNK